MTKEIKKITLRLVLAWIFSILFILGGIFGIAISFLGGILRLLAGLIIFPPLTKYCKEKYKLELSAWLKLLIVIILISISVGVSYANNSNQLGLTGDVIDKQITEIQEDVDVCNTDWSCSSWSECGASGIQTRVCTDVNNCGTSKNKPSETQSCTYQYKLSDRVIVDDVVYIVHSKTEDNQIGEYYDYYGLMGEEADGVFYIFDITVENVGKESTTFWGSNIKIYDTQGRTFDHDSTAEIYLDDSFNYDQIQPGLPKRGKIVFDVPKGLKGKLEISSTELFSDEKEYVSWN